MHGDLLLQQCQVLQHPLLVCLVCARLLGPCLPCRQGRTACTYLLTMAAALRLPLWAIFGCGWMEVQVYPPHTLY
jgi:hypothetical protein